MGISVARRAGGRADGSVSRIGWRTRWSATPPTRRRSRSRSSARSWSSTTSGWWRWPARSSSSPLDGRPVRRHAARSWCRPASRCGSAAALRGARAYLAVAGGIDVPPVLGSRATHLPSAMGGLGGPRAHGRRSPAAAVGRRAGAPAALVRPRHADRRRCRTAARRFACCRGRKRDRFAPTRSTRCSRRRTRSPPTRIAWDSGSTGRALTHARGADIISDATPLGVAAGAGVGPADSADGRSADDRRLSEDRDGDHRRHRPGRPARRRATRSRSPSARRGEALAALIAQEQRADGGRGGGVDDATSRPRCARRSADRVAARTCRSRRSRRSASAGRPTG